MYGRRSFRMFKSTLIGAAIAVAVVAHGPTVASAATAWPHTTIASTYWGYMWPEISGTRIAYSDNQVDNFAKVYDMSTGAIIPVPQMPVVGGLAIWGDTLAVCTGNNVTVYNLATRQTRVVSQHTGWGYGSIGVYGNSIVYSGRGTDNQYAIYLFDMAKGTETQLSPKRYGAGNSVRIYANNVVYDFHDSSMLYTTYAYNLATKSEKVIGTSNQPMAPDVYGNSVVYPGYTTVNGASPIHLYDLSTSRDRVLTPDNGLDPRISEGRMIYETLSSDEPRAPTGIKSVDLRDGSVSTVASMDYEGWEQPALYKDTAVFIRDVAPGDPYGDIVTAQAAWVPDSGSGDGATNYGAPSYQNQRPDPASGADGKGNGGGGGSRRPIVVLLAGLHSNTSVTNPGDEWSWLLSSRNNVEACFGKDTESVWVAPTAKGATAPDVVDSHGDFNQNAARLETWLSEHAADFKGHPIIIVAHSMGGIIARGLLDNPRLVQASGLANEFAGIIQLATPNAGSPGAALMMFVPQADWQNAAVCELSPARVLVWDLLHTNAVGRPIYRHGGWGIPARVPWLKSASDKLMAAMMLAVFREPNDGAVGAGSALYSPPYLLGTRVMGYYPYFHSNGIVTRGTVHLMVPDGADSDLLPNLRSEVAGLASRWSSAHSASKTMVRAAASTLATSIDAAQQSPLVLSEPEVVPQADNIHVSVPLDGAAIFSLTSAVATPLVTLSGPDGPVAVDVASLQSAGQYQTLFEVSPTTSGSYTLQVSLDGQAGGVVNVQGVAENGATLALSFSDVNAIAGRDTTLTATFADSAATPISGATVSAVLTLPDSSGQTVDLRDDGVAPDQVANDGVYTAVLTPSNNPGIWQVSATATKDSTQRVDTALIAVAAPTVGSFAGSISETTSPGTAGTIRTWTLQAPVHVDQDGTYTVGANVVDGSGTTVASPETQVTLTSGSTTTLTLDVSGADLVKAGTAPGALTVTSITLSSLTDSGSFALATAPDFTTRSYAASAFEAFLIQLDAASPDPTRSSTVTYTGTAVYTPGKIARVQYSTDVGSTWITATPVDGAWDSPVESYTFKLTGLADGLYSVMTRAVTNDGTTTPFGTYPGDRFILDSQAPTSVAGLMVDKTVTGGSASWTAPEPNLQTTAGLSYVIALDGSTVATTVATSYNLGLTDVALHTLSVTPVDDAGNRGPVTQLGISMAPMTFIALTPPAPNGLNGWYIVSAPTVTLSADTPGTTMYSWDGDAETTFTTPFAALEGSHTLSARTLSSSGTWGPSSIQSIKVDSIAPAKPVIGGYTAPLTAASSSAAIVTGTAEPGTVVTAKYTDSSSRSVSASSVCTGSYALVMNASSLADGNATLTLTCADAAGNASSDTRTLRKDSTAPTTTASLSGTLGENGWYKSTVQVSLVATDGAKGTPPLTTQYQLNGGAWTPYLTPISVSTEGTNTVNYRTVDFYGNTEATKTATVKVDTKAPVLVSTDPASGATGVLITKTVTITFNQSIYDKAISGCTIKKGSTTVTTTKSISGAVLSIKPSASLAKKTVYTVTVPVGAVKDVAGNTNASAITYSFTTQS